MSSLMIGYLDVECLNRQTNAGVKLTPSTAVGVSNNSDRSKRKLQCKFLVLKQTILVRLFTCKLHCVTNCSQTKFTACS